MTKIQIAMYEKFGQAVLLKGAFQKGDLLKKVEVEWNDETICTKI